MTNHELVGIAAANREKVRLLTAEGRTLKECAEIIGITQRSVERYRERLGISVRRDTIWTEDMERLALNLLEDGCPYSEVARTLGHYSTHPVRTRFPGYGRGGNPLGNGRHCVLAEELGLGLLQ